MPIVRRTRTLVATQAELWETISDPHHLPRWWPRVSRVEGVDEDAFTEVLVSDKGKVMRADFHLLSREDGLRVVWGQQIEGTPFARVLKSAETEIALAPATDPVADDPAAATPGTLTTPLGKARGTKVTIELRQTMKGFEWGTRWGVLWRGGSFLVRRAATATIDEALDNLERIVGGSPEESAGG